VSAQLLTLLRAQPPWLPCDAQLGRLAGRFRGYAQLPAAQRKELVFAAKGEVEALVAALRVSHGGAAQSQAQPPPRPVLASSERPAPGAPAERRRPLAVLHSSERAAERLSERLERVPDAHALLAASRAVDTGAQGSVEWLHQRSKLMTGSTFGNALGLHGLGRVAEFWEERVGLRAAFAGNSFTEWGKNTESTGLAAYTRLTGNAVDTSVSLAVCPPDAAGEEPWIGASPDGLLISSPGVLEIKCPASKFERALPYADLPAYYVPQLLGLMHVFERDFAHLFVYTMRNGCSLYTVPHQRAAWAGMRGELRRIWFDHVLPARAFLAEAGDSEAAREEARRRFRPQPSAERVSGFKAACAAIQSDAVRRDFTPAELL